MWRYCILLLVVLSLARIGALAQQGQDSQQSRAANEASRNIHGREKWFRQGRVTYAEPAAGLRYRAHLQKMRLRAALRERQNAGPNSPNPNTPQPSSPTPLVPGNWIQLGPAPIVSDASGVGLQDYNFVAGRATAVAIDPADATGNTVYVGGAYGGVWKSINAGPLSSNPASVSWTPLTDNQPTLAVGSIAIQPQSSNPDSTKSVILVGTGETNGSADSYYGLGILRSADAGNTWTLISQDKSPTPRQFAGLGFSKIAFSATNPSLVVAAAGATAEGITENLENPVLANRGIYYSTDAGSSWSYATVKDGSTVIDPASVSSVVYNAAAGEFFAAISLHGIYSSADGENWSRLNSQPGAGLTTASCPSHIASPSVCPIYRGEFADVPNRTGPSGMGEMYVWYVEANDNDGGIWTSANGGASWSQINDSGITNCGDLFGGCGTSQGSYNLVLAAVPSGTATDLYAGAVNLYKCTISVISLNCGGTGSGTFINLTHAYGCSSIAKVNPSQHSIAFLLINNNSQDVMYFANDGGIYRALDGYTGLVTGACGGINLFDSLNDTLGSITQLISFSQSSSALPNDQILLAGAQGNGSPGTNSSQSNIGWQNVNAGDGGYTAISPDDDNLWFVSNPPDSVSGVNIFCCDLGAGCHTQDFQSNNPEVVSGSTVGGDTGAFNTPYILDPQNPGEMLVGTCRVWRGLSSGGSFINLSNSFETAGTGICSGNETNLVRSLAAGGALDSNGFSNVIYTGTNGDGPLAGTSPTGGHIWVSTNAAGGPSTWIDQTGSINPDNFPISAIALDGSDKSGLTAYVTIMGFHVSHIWKTNNGGASWTDFTGNLPDAPANAAVVDPGITPATGIVYVGTDVGVFASTTASPVWTEVGPAPGSGSPGYLPNIAVTALQIFDPTRTKQLRASTYGRGLWQLTNFNLSRPVPGAITVAASATSGPVTMQLTSAGLNAAVNFSCTGLPPGAVCNFLPGKTVGVSPGNPVTITLTITTLAGTPGGTFSVAIHAGSSGEPTMTQNLSVTVTGGFNFSIVNTSVAQTVAAGAVATYNLNVVPSSGTFPSAVDLALSGCPASSTCSLSSSQVLAGNGSTSVLVTIRTTSGTPAGVYTMTVTGTSGSLTANAVLSLTVQSSGFSFSMTNSGPATIAAGASGKYDVTITPSVGTFPNAVGLTFTGCPTQATCSLSSAQVAAGSGLTDVFLTVTTSAAETPIGTYTISVIGTSGALTANTTISFTVLTGPGAPFSFSMSSSGPATIAVGASGQYDITVTPSAGTFPNPVALTFGGCPAVSTCSLSSAQVAAGSATTDVFLTIATTPPALNAAAKRARIRLYALWMSLPGLVIVFGSLGTNRSRRILLSLLSLALLSLCSACGGLTGGSAAPAGNPGTPVGTYTVTVIGTSGSLTANTTISLTVQSSQ